MGLFHTTYMGVISLRFITGSGAHLAKTGGVFFKGRFLKMVKPVLGFLGNL